MSNHYDLIDFSQEFDSPPDYSQLTKPIPFDKGPFLVDVFGVPEYCEISEINGLRFLSTVPRWHVTWLYELRPSVRSALIVLGAVTFEDVPKVDKKRLARSPGVCQSDMIFLTDFLTRHGFMV